MLRALVITLVLSLPAAAPAAPDHAPGTLCSSGKWGARQCIRPDHFVHDTCQAIEVFATRHGLDPHFFARLIWQESRFDPNALSPARAMGIAQFIASTAKLRRLADPWNPALALEHSAEYLGELTRRFGNMGLAAVAYNGGERRAEGLVAGTGGLARETVNYVQIITGLSAETWRDTPPERHDFRLAAAKAFAPACHDMARNRRYTKFRKPEPTFKPWGAQMAFGRDRNDAKQAFYRKTGACRGRVLRERIDYVPVRNRVSGRKGYVMARIGRNTAEAAQQLCDELRARGCACMVRRNP